MAAGADPSVGALMGFAFLIALATLIALLLKEPQDFIWGIAAEGDTSAILQDSALQTLQDFGVKHYRMSLPWATICQNQSAEAPQCHVNEEAVASYGNALRALRKRGIEPMVSMWQWNTPLDLDKGFGGFADREHMPIFFYFYAKTLLQHFGNDVKFWITLSDPDAALESGSARHAGEREKLADPYVRAHTMILSHAEAFRAWREAGSKGEISMALGGGHCEPLDPTGQLAAEPCPFSLFFDPVFRGDYSREARQRHKDLLEFTEKEKLRVHGSHMGVYYLNAMTSKQPDELQVLLRHLSNKYGGIRILIARGSSGEANDPELSVDHCRSIREPLLRVARAVAEGVHVYGYFAAAGDLERASASQALQWFASSAVPLEELPEDGKLPPCAGHVQSHSQ